jgi:hypothetical protein
MALSIQQRIAYLENELKNLKDDIQEEENTRERKFTIQFEYITTNQNWEENMLNAWAISDMIASRMHTVSDAMNLSNGLSLKNVSEIL